MRRTAVVLAVMLSSPLFGSLCLPEKGDPENVNSYLLTFSRALSFGYDPIVRAEKAEKPKTDDLLTLATAVMADLKATQRDYDCAAAHLAPYVSSKNEAINTSAKAAQTAFVKMSDMMKQSVGRYRDLLDGRVPTDKVGSMAEQAAEDQAQADDAWRLVPLAAAAATYALVELGSDGKKTGRLMVSTPERDRIREELKATFGTQIEGGLKARHIPIVAAAALLYDFLGKQSWKSRESPG